MKGVSQTRHCPKGGGGGEGEEGLLSLKMYYSITEPGFETCFAPGTREAGWGAKHISNDEFLACFEKPVQCSNL